MMTCERCGAAIDPSLLACPYCKLTTPAGIRARERDEHAARVHAEWQRGAELEAGRAAKAVIERTATHALGWSIAGLALCCLPLGAIGVFQGVRARSLATAQRTPMPVRATVGMWLGIVGSITSILVITWASVSSSRDQSRANARIAELEAETRSKAEAPTLDRNVACALAEGHALKTGYSGTSGYLLHGFACVGKLSTRRDTAAIEDFSFHSSGSSFKVNVCFKRGATWYVGEMRADACPSGK